MVAFFAGAALVEGHRAAYCKGYGASHEEEGDDYTSIGWGGANDCIYLPLPCCFRFLILSCERVD